MSAGLRHEGVGGGPPDYGEGGMFPKLCGNVTTALLTHHRMLQEFLALKDELLKYSLPSNMVLAVTIMISRVYRSYGDLCSPVGELCRLVQEHSGSWEKKSEGLKKIRQDYDSMRRKMNVTLQMMEGLAAQEEQRIHERRLGHWERLYCHVMQSKSHGRRWKFKIEPLRRKIASGWNPFQESFSSASSDSDGQSEQGADRVRAFQSPSSKATTVERYSAVSRLSEAMSEKLSSNDALSAKSTFTPPIQTVDVAMDTSDPSFKNYLLMQLHRPTGVAENANIFCTVTLGDSFYTSEQFPIMPADPHAPSHQSFHFPLTDDMVKGLSPSTTPMPRSRGLCRLVVGVYPRNMSQPLVATLSLPLEEVKLVEEPIVIVPPQAREEEEFEVDWQKLSDEASATATQPYLLTLKKEREQTDYEVDDPLVHMTCHRVKVQKHQLMHYGTVTMDWESLMSTLGYGLLADTQSRAVSAMTLDVHSATPVEEEPDIGPTRSEVKLQLEKDKEEALNILREKYQAKMDSMETRYQEKVRALSRTLAQVKAEKTKRITELEETLVEMESLTGKGKRSLADVKRMVERKRATTNMGLPQWGKDLPEDFLERLDMFNEERSRRKEEHVDKIKREVSRVCEEQLAVQHKLAPGKNMSLEYDLTLPAIFLPSSKNLTFSPRAHQFFHPTGSTKKRLTQPPAVFKLPPLQLGQPTRQSRSHPLQQHNCYHDSSHTQALESPPFPSSISCDDNDLPARPNTTPILQKSSSTPPLLPRRQHSAEWPRNIYESHEDNIYQEDPQIPPEEAREN